jgi:hypothetical protein
LRVALAEVKLKRGYQTWPFALLSPELVLGD